jgi:hypothetical protein
LLVTIIEAQLASAVPIDRDGVPDIDDPIIIQESQFIKNPCGARSVLLESDYDKF